MLRIALACTFATLLLPVGAAAQLGGLDAADIELPPAPDAPVELPEVRVPPADELLDDVEQGTGVDLPAVGGQPSGQPPPSTQDQPDPAPAVGAPPAPPAADPGGGATVQGPSANPRSSSPSGPRTQRAASAGPEAGVGDERPSRERSGASSTEVEDGAAEASPVDRVFEAIGGIPWALMAAIAALAVLGFAMTGRSALLVRLTRRLTNQGDELREDVGALQTALLPTIPERIGDVALSVAYRAAEGPAAGGDFHDVLSLERGRLAIVVGDVSGHGREALTVTPLIHYTVRAYLEAGMQPRQALRLADEALGHKLGRDFATVLAAIYDPATSSLAYASAGHLLPLVLGAERDHAVSEMTPPPIGVGPPTGFRQTRIALPTGSRVCFFTDGLVEPRDEDGSMLGREGLARSLAGLAVPEDAEAALDHVAGPDPGADDLTILLMTPLDAGGDGTVVEELEPDPAQDPESLRDYLEACGLDASAAGDAISAVAKRTGSATPLLRVRRDRDEITWELAHADAVEALPSAARPAEPATTVLAS